MKRKLYRQGDLLIIPATTVPADATPVNRVAGRVILAEGEATGHHHAIHDAECELLETDVQEMRQRFLRVEAEAGVALVHEEHATITLPPGLYEVRRQREYAPEELRFVSD